MKLRYKILLIVIAIGVVYFAADFLLNPPLQAASNTSLEGFVCSNETQTLTSKQQQLREIRAKQLEKALSDTIGIRMEGHDIIAPGIGPRPKKVYEMQKKLSIEDWEILSEIYVEKYEQWRLNSKDIGDAIGILFAIRGDEAIAILECKVGMQQSYFSDIRDIKGLSKSPGFQLKYEKYRKQEQR
jgi:hypothetical protein